MKLLQIGSVLAATTIMTIFHSGKNLLATAAEYSPETPAYLGSSVVINRSSQNDLTASHAEEANDQRSVQTKSDDYPFRGQSDLSYLAFIRMRNFHLQESRRTLCW